MTQPAGEENDEAVRIWDRYDESGDPDLLEQAIDLLHHGLGQADVTPELRLNLTANLSDKDDVETMGLLKLDVLGIRMQSAMSHALTEIARVDGPDAARAGRHPDQAGYLSREGVINLDAVPLDDEATYRLIRTTHTLGCFQIESPGQRELVGKFGPETFRDLIIDISLFRPGPVKSDMIRPFLRTRRGGKPPQYIHPALEDALRETGGVVVFHEQVLRILHVTTGISLAEADEVRRGMGSTDGQAQIQVMFREKAMAHGFDHRSVELIWEVLKAFASFGFCKAHAAAFALPTYQSAWLKAHHPAAFLAGVLTHDPGMYPKRLILDDARNLGISVLPVDVNHSGDTYRVERLEDAGLPAGWDDTVWSTNRLRVPEADLPDGRAYGIRIPLSEVHGASAAEVARMVAGRPYESLADFWHRAHVSRPVVEKLIIACGFDSLYGLSEALPVPARGRITRRDLLLQAADLERWTRSTQTSTRRSRRGPAPAPAVGGVVVGGDSAGVRQAAARQSQAAAAITPAGEQPVQLALALGDAPDQVTPSGLPEMTGAERVRAELEVLGLDASRHVLDFYAPLLTALGVIQARDVPSQPNRATLLVAGVKVATQTPPIRTGRRVVFLTLDDSTGPIDATFFEDVQGHYAATVFGSWLLVVSGMLRRTGARGISLTATGAWDLPTLWDLWTRTGLDGVHAALRHTSPQPKPTERSGPGRGLVPVEAGTSAPGRAAGGVREDGALPAAVASETGLEEATGLPRGDRLPAGDRAVPAVPAAAAGPHAEVTGSRAGGMGGGRVLVHASGYRQSPYADLKPPGGDTRATRRLVAAEDAEEKKQPPRESPGKLWHTSPGSSGR